MEFKVIPGYEKELMKLHYGCYAAKWVGRDVEVMHLGKGLTFWVEEYSQIPKSVDLIIGKYGGTVRTHDQQKLGPNEGGLGPIHIHEPFKSDLFVSSNTAAHIIAQPKLPLKFIWKPKEDITTFELAQCIPYINANCHTREMVNTSQSYFRHFEIIDPN